MVLVLDDYHEIQSKAIHDAVGFLLQDMPRRMHVIIASRHGVPFPWLVSAQRGR